MLKEGKFGLQEAVWLSTIAISNKAFYTSPATLINLVGTTGWYMTIISTLTATVAFSFIYLLMKRFPGQDLVDIFEISLGRVIGFIFAASLAAMLMFNASSTVREFTEVLKVYILPLSPPQFIIIMFLLPVMILCFLGLESIARTAQFVSNFLVISFVVVMLLASKHFDINNLFPILGEGFKNTVQHGLLRSSAYGEVIVLAIVAKSLQNTGTLKKAGYISLAFSGILISVSILGYLLSFPYHTASEITAPMYQMARMINYGRFVQRIEPLFLYIWLFSSLIGVTVVFYSFLSIYCKIFRIQDLRPVILPAAIVLYSLSILPKDLTTIAFGSVQYLRNFSWIIYFGLPLVTLFVAVWRNKKGLKDEAEKRGQV